MTWTIEDSAKLYGVDRWGSGHFRVNEKGHVAISSSGNKGLDIYELVQDLRERGIRPPILVRLSNLVQERVDLINRCFAQAIQEYDYQGHYKGVFPIKVNQQRHLMEEIIKYGRPYRMGLECGSKPELLVALAMMDTPEAHLICNGFKDSEYIETALLSRKLGRDTIIVVDRAAELDLIINAAKQLDIKPVIGFRAKLYTRGAGKWMESSGTQSKFGLTPPEIMDGIERLKAEGMLSSLELLHAHIGSQIPSIQHIKSSIKEVARIFTELYTLGATPRFVDVGGGLGVDYDGSGRGESSTNYSEQEYANDVVSIIQTICDEKKVPHPNIISESGRALIAHSSLLVFNVLGKNELHRKSIKYLPEEEDSAPIKELFHIYETVNQDNINEYFNDLTEKRMEVEQLFSFGGLGLRQRAKAEDLHWAIATKMSNLSAGLDATEDIYWKLQEQLSNTYFCNFSVFQSLPDVWAVGQLFPVMPIHRLDEKPGQRAVIADLTCDSDGRIDRFIDTESDSPQSFLEVHELLEDEPYFLGVFLTGAYQETLGDLHNLFGDTDAVHVTITENGYTVDGVVEGDSVTQVLEYVEYNRPELIQRIRQCSEQSIMRGQLTKREARLLMRHYEQGLSGYTYLEDPEA